MRRQRGFTLVEIVVALGISAIVVGFMAAFMVTPVDSYLAQQRRTELADSANNATRMLGNDVRSALPESVRFVRNGSVVALELLLTTDVVRYRETGSAGDSNRELDFAAADSRFSTLSAFTLPIPPTAYLVVGHTGMPGQNAYTGANVISPPGTGISPVPSVVAPGEDDVTLSPPVTFTAPSPKDNAFIVSGPIAYLCDESAHTLTRFWNYPITPSLSAHDSAAKLNGDGAASSLVARDIAGCELSYSPGTPQHGGLVTLSLTVSRDGESLHVLHQMQVENVP